MKSVTWKCCSNSAAGLCAVPWVLLAALTLAGCAKPKPPPPPLPTTLPSYTPQMTPATQYYGLVPPQRLTNLEQTMREQIELLFTENKMPTPLFDERMVLVARELGRFIVKEKRMPSIGLERQVALWAGMGESSFITLIRTAVGHPDAAKLVKSITTDISALKRRPPNYYAIGLFEPANSADTALVILFLNRMVQLDPVAKKAPVDGKVAIRGRLADAQWRASATLSVAGDKPKSLKIKVSEDGSFALDVQLPPSVDKADLELMAETKRSRTPLVNFPVYVLGTEPLSHVLPEVMDESKLTADSAGQLLLEWVNRDRASQGLPALKEHQQVSMLAVRWSGIGGVDLPTAKAQLRERGITFFALRPTLLKGTSIARLYDKILESPALKQVFFDPIFTQAGIGVTMIGAGDQRNIVVAATLICAPEAGDPAVLREQFLRRVNELRENAGLPAMTLEHRLDALLAQANSDLEAAPSAAADVRATVREAIQRLQPPAKLAATTFFSTPALEASLPQEVVKSFLRAERTKLAVDVRPITLEKHPLKGLLVYYVVFGE